MQIRQSLSLFVRLYNLADGPSEHKHLASQQPGKLKELAEALDGIRVAGGNWS